MRQPNKRTETPFRELLEGAGLSIPSIIHILDGKLIESKRNLSIINEVLDANSKLAERVKILELELFIALLKKI